MVQNVSVQTQQADPIIVSHDADLFQIFYDYRKDATCPLFTRYIFTHLAISATWLNVIRGSEQRYFTLAKRNEMSKQVTTCVLYV